MCSPAVLPLQLGVHTAEYGAVVNYAPSFEVSSVKSPLMDNFRPCAQAKQLVNALVYIQSKLFDTARGEYLVARFYAQQELIHRRIPRYDDLVFPSIARHFIERHVDLTGIDILAANREHVIDASEDSVRQSWICPAARCRIVDPSR